MNRAGLPPCTADIRVPRVRRAVPVAGFELGLEHQAQVADPVSVDGMAGAPRLVRVVADHGTGLLAVQHLDRGVAIQNPGRGGGLRNAVLELVLHPLRRSPKPGLLRCALRLGVLGIGRRRDGAQGTPQAVVADDLVHAQDARGHAVTAQCAHMGVAAMSVQNRQHPGAQHIEPRQGQWRFDALPKADSGAASVRVFLDDNANGVMDAGEEPIENVALTVNGNRALARTNAAGIAWLDGLPIRQHVDIAVDTQTLEDPYWVPQRKGLRLVPRPGHATELDFAVVLTSEIDGTVYLVEKTSRRGIGDVVIELLDSDGKVVSAIKSSSDGYYIVPAVVQGRYSLRVSPQQLQQLGLSDPGMRAITITPDGKFFNGVDFLLSRNPDRTVSTSPREESHDKK